MFSIGEISFEMNPIATLSLRKIITSKVLETLEVRKAGFGYHLSGG